MLRFVVALSMGFIVLGSNVVFGQAYPNKPIRIITGGAGGGSDFISRQVAQEITGPLGQSVIVDNRVSLIAAETVAKSPPDGYNLLVQGSILWVLPLLRKTSYDAANDFAPVSLVSREVNVIAVHPSVPVKSIKELIALAKARPGEINYGMTSIGGPAHLGAELLKSMAGINLVAVPYKADAMAVTALVSGEVQLAIYDAGVVAPHVKAGKLRALAVTSAQPSALSPGLPTVAASLPGYEAVGMTCIFAPANTPSAIISRLNQEIVRALNQPAVKERFLNSSEEIVASSPETLVESMKTDIARWSKVIKDANIKVN